MKKILFLIPLLTLACAQSPKKEYSWTSLSEKGFTKNNLTVLKEDKVFQSDGGFENLEQKKITNPDKSADKIRKIILIGDTGCRLKEGGPKGDAYQDCNGGKDWIYKDVMAKVAAENPDLILHVGDYHYREQCSEGKVCRKYTDTIGYGWRAWEADFFSPSQKGFEIAPWIFVRGNHEECRRAYAGYKLITEQAWDKPCVDTEKTEYIQIGNLLIVQLDSASISDKPETPEAMAFWDQQFKDIETHLAQSTAKKVWLVTHKPLVGFVNDSKGELKTLNINLQKAFAKTKLNKRIEFLIGGHIHNTQFVRAEGFPKQIVVGNSGTSLDNVKGLENREALLHNAVDGLNIDDFFTDTKSGRSFGYAVMTKMDEDSWQLQFKDTNGEVTFTSLDVATPAMKIKTPKKPSKKKK